MTHLQMQNVLLKKSLLIMTCTAVIQNESCLSLSRVQMKMKNPTGRGGNSISGRTEGYRLLLSSANTAIILKAFLL